MIISFEEKDRAVIEAKGISIIEFKQRLYNMVKTIDDAWKILEKWVDKVTKAWNLLTEKFLEAVDGFKLVFEQIKEAYHYPTLCRYRIVKIFSKCTGTDIRFSWKIIFKIKRWLARSCC